MVLKFESITNRMEAYETEVKNWKRDHDLAMKCLDLELMLQFSISVFEAINFLDEKFRLWIANGDLEHSQEIDSVIGMFYQRWADRVEDVLKAIEFFEKKGFSVSYSDGFRSACREVSGILTEDTEFFSGEKLTELRDSAIDEFHRGECEAI